MIDLPITRHTHTRLTIRHLPRLGGRLSRRGLLGGLLGRDLDDDLGGCSRCFDKCTLHLSRRLRYFLRDFEDAVGVFGRGVLLHCHCGDCAEGFLVHDWWHGCLGGEVWVVMGSL